MTSQTKAHKGLGRGLSSLLGDMPAAALSADGTPAPAREVSIAFISPNPWQPRKSFQKEPLDDLIASIKEKGLLQPLVVRPNKDRADRYELVAGERRWRAAQAAGLHQVPVIVRSMSDKESLEIAIIENVQRENLTAIEEAEGYKRLVDEFNHTQDQVASFVGKSRSHVTNLLRLLSLQATVQRLVNEGSLSMGHARALIGIADAESLALRAVKEGLSVRDIEALARGAKARGPQGGIKRLPGEKDPDTRAVERELSLSLGLKAELKTNGEAGTLLLHYKDLDQLDDLLNRLRA